MLKKPYRFGVVVAGGVLVAVLAVACAGATDLPSPGAAGGLSVAGFTIQVPALPLPFANRVVEAPAARTTTQLQAPLRDAVHSGGACPLALPQ